MSYSSACFLGVAGFVAGIIGTAGGITTLVAYPALLAVGIRSLAANVTNSGNAGQRAGLGKPCGPRH
jgi:uncharacterized membrane protein YfcA